jgi:predicted ATPase
MLGRALELRHLQDAFEQTRRNRDCQLVTILGAAGVGKSRLAHEFLASLDGAAVLRGRCLSYGDGITYWPVAEIVRQLEPRLPKLSLDEDVLATLRGFLGADDAKDSTEEIAFAVRRLLEAAARELPVVCLFDDIQWGEPAFLELIEQVAALSRDAELLLCCLARPELLERHPGWGSGLLNAARIALEPLSDDQAEQLIDHLAGDSQLAGALKTNSGGAEATLFAEETSRSRGHAGTRCRSPDITLRCSADRWTGRLILQRGASRPCFHSALCARARTRDRAAGRPWRVSSASRSP